jgi:hypothetical protein
MNTYLGAAQLLEARSVDLAAVADSGIVYLEGYLWDPAEARAAREKGVTYVKLDGEVGILGNGAGLVMSTLDVIALAGGRPANFCDLGGGGDAQGVVDALEVITGDPQVRSILFNIFGGITRCDEVARGILQALDQMTISHPIVVRLDGTNAEEGRKLLAEASPPNLHVEPTMLDAARRAVELAQGRTSGPTAPRPTARARHTARGPTSTSSSSGPPERRPGSTSPPAAGTSRAGCVTPASRSSPPTRRRACSRTSSAGARSSPSPIRASTSSPAGSPPTTSPMRAPPSPRWHGFRPIA